MSWLLFGWSLDHSRVSVFRFYFLLLQSLFGIRYARGSRHSSTLVGLPLIAEAVEELATTQLSSNNRIVNSANTNLYGIEGLEVGPVIGNDGCRPTASE